MQLQTDERETITGTAALLRRGRITCGDLVEQCLDRIDEWEPKIHAWVLVDREGARLRARQLDAERKTDARRGPLHGIPIGIKDIIDVAGFPTAAGSRQMAEIVAAGDATIVRKLREAGAILLGKTVTTQFACFDPPPTRNPWNLDHTPGGSSSGSAAAVATGMCLGAIGSQTGGSITRPAAYCGVAGCKPTHGRVSLSGIVPLAPSLDHPGLVGRCVSDLAILLDAISGYDPDDPRSIADAPPMGLLDEFPQTGTPPKLARLRGFFETAAHPHVLAAFESTLGRLRAAGASLVEIDLPPSFADVHQQHRTIMQYELAGAHRERFCRHRDDYLSGVAKLIEEGLAVSESAYRSAKSHQARACEEIGAIFRDAEVAVCPAAVDPAPDRSTTGDPAFNSPWSYTGLPTVSFPIDLSPQGLPVGIQLVGRPFDERQLFRVARWCEAALMPRTALVNVETSFSTDKSSGD